MFATVTITTFNRSQLLAKTLESLCSLRCPERGDYEILVVDNNSNDKTAEIIGHYQELLTPRLRSIFELKQGLSHARNRALKEAKGEIVCFLDDDVEVDRDWLIAVMDSFEKYSAAVVGGPSYLIFSSNRPFWLPKEYEYLLSRLDYGDKVIVDTDKSLFGLNFAVRRNLALEVGGFDATLGRVGKSLNSGEELDLLRKIRRKGGIAVYDPRARVGHIVASERLRMRWFLKRNFANGICCERIRIKDGISPNIRKSAIRMIRCLGSIPKSFVKGDFSFSTFFDKSLSLAEALGVLMVSISQSISFSKNKRSHN